MTGDRYGMRQSTIVSGRWIVFDQRSGRMLRALRDEQRASRLVDRLNRDDTRNRVCPRCRHRRRAALFVGGVCADCQ